MFTTIELARSDWNVVGLALNIVADCIFFGALYWGYKKEKIRGKNERDR